MQLRVTEPCNRDRDRRRRAREAEFGGNHRTDTSWWPGRWAWGRARGRLQADGDVDELHRRQSARR
jgi:hypothetical protein